MSQSEISSPHPIIQTMNSIPMPFILIGVIGLLLILVVIFLSVCFCYLKNKYCFHRENLSEDKEMLLDVTRSEKSYMIQTHTRKNSFSASDTDESTAYSHESKTSDGTKSSNEDEAHENETYEDVTDEDEDDSEEGSSNEDDLPDSSHDKLMPISIDRKEKENLDYDLENSPLGAISIRCFYSHSKKSIKVKIIRAKGVSFVDPEGQIYTRIIVTNFYKSATIKRTELIAGENPKFYEELSFPGSKSQMEFSSLLFQAYVNENLKGEAIFVPGILEYRATWEGVLKLREPYEVHTFDIVKMIHHIKNLRKAIRHLTVKANYPKVLLGLCYNEAFEELKLTVLTASHLQGNSLFPPDTQIKISLISFYRVEVASRKSKVMVAQGDPYYDLGICFMLPSNEKLSTTIVLSIYKDSALTFDSLIGSFSIGTIGSSTLIERSHWDKMLANPGASIDSWHLLYSLRRFWAFH